MEKLRLTIKEYDRWKELETYIDRIEGHLESDFSHSLENAKALLETIAKEICAAKQVELRSNSSINAVLKKAFSAIGYSGDELITSISSALATIGQQLGNLRNEISPTSHGRSLDELRDRNNKVNLMTREFLVDSTMVIAVLMIRAFEDNLEVGASVPTVEVDADDELLKYEDSEAFNESWDESFGEFTMGTYSFLASEILFGLDYQAYKTEYNSYIESNEDQESEDET